MTEGGRPRVLVVVGTRPEAIKMAPVLAALRARDDALSAELVLTGQHSELVTGALAAFGLRADHDLAIMRDDQTVYDVAEGCLKGLRRIVAERHPRLLLVQGDTASAFFGALVAYLEDVAVGHVEAGLRSGDLRRPFPEEGFRRLVAVLAELHFAPTDEARANLLREGIPAERVHVTGNPVVDALLHIAAAEGGPEDPTLARLVGREGPFALLTAHRRESFGAPLEAIFGAVLELVERRPELEVIYPVHPNPSVREPAARILGRHPRVHTVAPLGYPDLVRALESAALVLTDSGGIQEEAPTFGTPVLVLREVTERPEGVRAGAARLVGADPERIVREAEAALDEGDDARARRRGANPYGDGRAGVRIAAEVVRHLAGGRPSGAR